MLHKMEFSMLCVVHVFLYAFTINIFSWFHFRLQFPSKNISSSLQTKTTIYSKHSCALWVIKSQTVDHILCFLCNKVFVSKTPVVFPRKLLGTEAPHLGLSVDATTGRNDQSYRRCSRHTGFINVKIPSADAQSQAEFMTTG